ncbi:hypothetical protein BDR26DRAFT_855787 [Obelidium mucronatum]|nr:hypothetical protein BDR26DRAFT_855787 [Obelidium mucronatum]
MQRRASNTGHKARIISPMDPTTSSSEHGSTTRGSRKRANSLTAAEINHILSSEGTPFFPIKESVEVLNAKISMDRIPSDGVPPNLSSQVETVDVTPKQQMPINIITESTSSNEYSLHSLAVESYELSFSSIPSRESDIYRQQQIISDLQRNLENAIAERLSLEFQLADCKNERDKDQAALSLLKCQSLELNECQRQLETAQGMVLVLQTKMNILQDCLNATVRELTDAKETIESFKLENHQLKQIQQQMSAKQADLETTVTAMNLMNATEKPEAELKIRCEEQCYSFSCASDKPTPFSCYSFLHSKSAISIAPMIPVCYSYICRQKGVCSPQFCYSYHVTQENHHKPITSLPIKEMSCYSYDCKKTGLCQSKSCYSYNRNSIDTNPNRVSKLEQVLDHAISSHRQEKHAYEETIRRLQLELQRQEEASTKRADKLEKLIDCAILTSRENSFVYAKSCKEMQQEIGFLRKRLQRVDEDPRTLTKSELLKKGNNTTPTTRLAQSCYSYDCGRIGKCKPESCYSYRSAIEIESLQHEYCVSVTESDLTLLDQSKPSEKWIDDVIDGNGSNSIGKFRTSPFVEQILDILDDRCKNNIDCLKMELKVAMDELARLGKDAYGSKLLNDRLLSEISVLQTPATHQEEVQAQLRKVSNSIANILATDGTKPTKIEDISAEMKSVIIKGLEQECGLLRDLIDLYAQSQLSKNMSKTTSKELNNSDSVNNLDYSSKEFNLSLNSVNSSQMFTGAAKSTGAISTCIDNPTDFENLREENQFLREKLCKFATNQNEEPAYIKLNEIPARLFESSSSVDVNGGKLHILQNPKGSEVLVVREVKLSDENLSRIVKGMSHDNLAKLKQ